MFAIEYTPEARRTLETLPGHRRQLVSQLLHAVAEMAEIFPEDTSVWQRLGKVADKSVEVDVEGRPVQMKIDPARRQVHVVRVGTGRSPSAKRTRSTLVPPELRTPRRAKLRAQ